MNTKKKRLVRSACVFCCALLFFCVCAFYFVYKTRTDIRVKKTINYIMQVLVELEAKKHKVHSLFPVGRIMNISLMKYLQKSGFLLMESFFHHLRLCRLRKNYVLLFGG